MSDLFRVVDWVQAGTSSVIIGLLILLARSVYTMEKNHLKHVETSVKNIETTLTKVDTKVDDLSQRVAHVEGKLDIMGGL